jgi:hypothetical protein
MPSRSGQAPSTTNPASRWWRSTDTVSQGKPSTGAMPVRACSERNARADMALKRDLEAAKAHLAKCKYKPEDINLELSWIGEVPLEERFALLMQANFAEIGIKSEIKKLPWALFSEQVSKPENTPNFAALRQLGHRRSRHAALRHVSLVGRKRHLAVAGISAGRRGRRAARQGPHGR